MKFTDGYWALREGVTLHSPAVAYETRLEPRAITVFAPVRPIRHRGDTLNCPVLTFRFDSPAPDVIRVKVLHFAGTLERGPSYGIRETGDHPVELREDEDSVRLVSGRSSVRIAKTGDWSVEFFDGSRRLTGTGPGHTAYIVDADGRAYFREQLELAVGESIYGLGERFTPLVRNGQTVDLWNEDGGTSSEQAYKNVPFFVSSRGYGVWAMHPEKVSYEIGSEVVSRVQFSVPGEELEYCLVGGGSMKAVLSNYTAISGRPALPPAWSFGLWLTTSFTTSYDEATIHSFIDGMRERDIPLSVFHFDCFWMKEFQWCDFEWRSESFPDPAANIRRVKEKGLRVCVWINPYVAQKSPLFAEGRAKGYLVRRPDGSTWQWDRWQAGMGLVDFTNPEARAWYQDALRSLVRQGVDCFKTDFGERIPVDVAWHDGSDPMKMHNYYSYLYNEAVFEVLEGEKGAGNALVFARSATAGGQKFPVHWGGDCSGSYASMAETLRGGLSLGLSGFGFWSHDISGFELTATPDLYKRWAAFGLLSSHSRLHGNESYRVPWLFDEEAVDVLRSFTKLKCRLMPYIFAQACATVATGLPMMRAMALEFPDDPATATLDRQYMLGENLLVAPVFDEGGRAAWYLPEGRWTHFLDGSVVAGPRWVGGSFDYFSLPLFARPGSVIAVGPVEDRPDYDYSDGPTFHVFEPVDGATAIAELRRADGSPGGELTLTRRGRSVEASLSAARGDGAPGAAERRPWKLLLRGIPRISSLSAGETSAESLGSLVSVPGGLDHIRVEW
jgi:alpha-D-xyloside xylohydrolase